MISNTVLLIDDELDLIEELADSLSSEFNVLTAGSGAAGLEIIVRDAPGAIVCDLSMPGMSGLEVLERVRAMPHPIGNTPFVFLTAHGGLEEEVKGRGLGADDYVAKPVDLKRLAAIISTRLTQAERFELAAGERVEEARKRITQAACDRMEAMEQAFLTLRPLLRAAAGANVQLTSLMEGLEGEELVNLSRSAHEKIRQAQNIVRAVGILAAVPPLGMTVQPATTRLLSIVQDGAEHAIAKFTHVMVNADESTIFADPAGVKAMIAGVAVWASERIPNARIDLTGDVHKLTMRIVSDHRSASEIDALWNSAQGNSNDPADFVARLADDIAKAHGGDIVSGRDGDAFVLKASLSQSL
jgi:DNA-binding response OmpR family regulator